MKWKHPSKTKTYEAIGAVADGRMEIDGNTGNVYSSSRNKYYEVTYDPASNAIMSNDSSSYWKGELGYPAIAFLMAKGILKYSNEAGAILKGIPWKDINQKYKNDFEKALESILATKTEKERSMLAKLVDEVDAQLRKLHLNMLGAKVKPPEGY